jgi:hypothetical protein
LREIGFADFDVRRSAFVSGDRIVEIELAGGILLVKRPDAVQVALGFQCLRTGFVQLSPRPVRPGAIKFRIDDKEGLSFVDMRSFGEKHLLEIAFHTGVDFDELLCPDPSHIFPVYVHVVRSHRFDRDDRVDGLLRLRT